MQPETKRAVMALLIAVAGLIGLYIAAAGATWRGYYGGLLLFVGAAITEFRLIDQHFDIKYGKRDRLELLPLGWLVPRSTLDQWFTGLVSAAAGIGGLISAGRSEVGTAGYDLGLLVFVLAVLYVFFLLKTGYDRVYGKH
jgi:hypothetical protein